MNELIFDQPKAEVNDVRQQDAEARILAAVDRLKQRPEPLTVTTVAEEARAHKATVSKVLGQRCIPLDKYIYKGMHRVPESPDVNDLLPQNMQGDLLVVQIDAAPESPLSEEEL